MIGIKVGLCKPIKVRLNSTLDNSCNVFRYLQQLYVMQSYHYKNAPNN